MRCKCLWSVALATAALAMLAAGYAAGQDGSRPSTAVPSSGGIRAKLSGNADAKDKDAVDEPGAVSPAEPKGRIPTPAKRTTVAAGQTPAEAKSTPAPVAALTASTGTIPSG